jgi:hypothetical protein
MDTDGAGIRERKPTMESTRTGCSQTSTNPGFFCRSASLRSGPRQRGRNFILLFPAFRLRSPATTTPRSQKRASRGPRAVRDHSPPRWATFSTRLPALLVAAQPRLQGAEPVGARRPSSDQSRSSRARTSHISSNSATTEAEMLCWPAAVDASAALVFSTPAE